MIRSMTPADLDPVEAASTPITPDPTVRARLNSSGADAEAVEMIARRLIKGGMDPAQAYEQARQQVLGEKQAVLESMGPPPGTRSREPEAPAPVAPVSPGQQPRTPEELIDMGMTAYRVHGATMPDGTRGRRTETLPNTDSAEAYTRRAERMPSTDPSEPGGTARYAPSDKDRDMMALGYVPVMGPDGSTSYQLSPDTGVRGMPGGPNRGGRRADLEAPLLKADGTLVLDQDGNPVPKWAVTMTGSPTGTLGEAEGSATVPVYSLSPQARQKHEAYLAERQLYRDAQRAGVSPAELYKQNEKAYGDLTAGGQRDRVNVRMAIEGNQQAKAAEREKAWRSQMMLAGGNPAKNAVNAYNQLNDPNTNDWQRLVLATQLGRGVDGVTPLGVQAQSAENALRLIPPSLIGEGLGGAGDARRDMLSQRSRNEAQAYFDKWHAANVGNGGIYRTEDHNSMVNYLMNQYALTLPQAEAIAQSHGAPKPAGFKPPTPTGEAGGPMFFPP